MNPRVRDIAKECWITNWYIGRASVRTASQQLRGEQLERFYQLAEAIRNLEITS